MPREDPANGSSRTLAMSPETSSSYIFPAVELFVEQSIFGLRGTGNGYRAMLIARNVPYIGVAFTTWLHVLIDCPRRHPKLTFYHGAMSLKTNKKHPYSLLPTPSTEEERLLLVQKPTPRALYGRLTNIWVYTSSIFNIACLFLNIYLLLISLHYEPSHLQESYILLDSWCGDSHSRILEVAPRLGIRSSQPILMLCDCSRLSS
jgi:hypothetical protein